MFKNERNEGSKVLHAFLLPMRLTATQMKRMTQLVCSAFFQLFQINPVERSSYLRFFISLKDIGKVNSLLLYRSIFCGYLWMFSKFNLSIQSTSSPLSPFLFTSLFSFQITVTICSSIMIYLFTSQRNKMKRSCNSKSWENLGKIQTWRLASYLTGMMVVLVTVIVFSLWMRVGIWCPRTQH